MSKQKTALISGASSGIGEALTAHFARGGYDLVLVARSADKLEALANQLVANHGVEVWVEPTDLAKRGAAKKLAASLAQQDIEIDVLVNNAGVLEHGNFVEIDPSLHQRMIDLNISGLTSMLDHFLPAMVERGSGKVLNVASIASFQPLPSVATYAASKAFVLSLTESLSEELKHSGVTITALCPGVTATNMLSTATESSEGLTKLPDFMIGDVEDVAAQGYKACMKGDVICVPGTINLVGTIAGRSTPKWLLRRITGLAGRYTAGG
ncbi:MAG: SDR family oxidoreductase [Halieaceae bacterium]